MRHNTQVTRRDNSYRAQCLQCGWVGPRRTTKGKAREDAIEHDYKTSRINSPTGNWAGMHGRGY